MSPPFITHVKYQNNAATRLPGNRLFTNNRHNHTTRFRLLLDSPIAMGTCVFKIGNKTINTHSVEPNNYLGSKRIVIVVNNTELINCEGGISIVNTQNAITETILPENDLFFNYSHFPTITNCSHNVVNITDDFIITLTGTGFEKNSYVSLIKPSLKEADVLKQECIFEQVFNIEPATIVSPKNNISKLSFQLSNELLPNLFCGVFYIIVVSPNSNIPTCGLRGTDMNLVLPLSGEETFSMRKIIIRPIITNILNTELYVDRPANITENMSDAILTAGRQHNVTIFGKYFVKDKTRVIFYSDLSGTEIVSIDSYSKKIEYVNSNQIRVNVPAIHIFRKIYAVVALEINGPSEQRIVSDINNIDSLLFVGPHISIENDNIYGTQSLPEFHIDISNIMIKTSHIFREILRPVELLLFYRFSDTKLLFTQNEYRIGYKITRDTNILETTTQYNIPSTHSTAAVELDYEQFIIDAKRCLQDASNVVIDVYAQITYKLPNNNYKFIRSNSCQIAFYENTVGNYSENGVDFDNGHSQSIDNCSVHSDDEIDNSCLYQPEHFHTVKNKDIQKSYNLPSYIEQPYLAYKNKLLEIGVDAGFDYTRNDEYLKNVGIFQTNSVTSRSAFMLLVSTAFFQLTGYGSGIRMEPHWNMPIPFSVHQNDARFTQNMRKNIQKLMMDVLLKDHRFLNDISVEISLYNYSVQGLCNHLLDVILEINDSDVVGYSPIVRYDLPGALSVSGADATTRFARQLGVEGTYYMLSPYTDDNNTIGEENTNLINQLLSSSINNDNEAINSIKSTLSSFMNIWITTVPFLLISDNGKYTGTSHQASIGELYSHYTQTIHSALVGNPNVNILSNMNDVRENISIGSQIDGSSNTLGEQFVNSIVDNAFAIRASILAADPSRQPPANNINAPILLKKHDHLIVYVDISGSIDNDSIDLREIFFKNVDPLLDNTSSFKNYLLTHEGNEIKPIRYAIVLPIG